MNQKNVKNSTTHHDCDMAGSQHNFKLTCCFSLEHPWNPVNTLEGLITHLSVNKKMAYRDFGFAVKESIDGVVEDGKEDHGDRYEG